MVSAQGQPSYRDLAAGPHEPALRIIVVYKLARAFIALGAAGLLCGLIATGHDTALREWADGLRLHLSSHWSSELARTMDGLLERRHLWLAVLALTFDGILVSLEGWALWRSYAWGAWLVVASTAALLPIEAIGLWRHPHLGRVLLLCGNVIVALYLARHVSRSRRSSKVNRSSHR